MLLSLNKEIGMIRINNFNVVSPSQQQKKQNLNKQHFCNTTDTFVESSSSKNSSRKISFTGKIANPEVLDNAVEYFTVKVFNLMRDNQFNPENLQQLVKEIAPDLRIYVKDFKDVKELDNKNIYTPSSFSGACLPSFINSAKTDIESTLAINFDKFNLNRDNNGIVLNTIQATAHEFRHAMDFMVEGNPMEYARKHIPQSDNAFTVFNKIHHDIGESFGIYDNWQYKPIPQVNESELLKFIGCKSNKEMKDIINMCISKNIHSLSPENAEHLDVIFKFFSKASKMESNGYKDGNNAIKIVLGIEHPIDADLIPTFYDKLIRYFDTISSSISNNK